MKSNSNDDGASVLFLGDTHFHVRRDRAEERRLARLIELLDRFRGIPHVVLLGDIFDFWFDYPHFMMKGYDSLLAALDRARAAGSRIHFIGGNHDIWAADFLHARLGTAADGGPVDLELDGIRVRCMHGDGLIGRNLLYGSFRKIVRHPAAIRLAKSLHPEALWALSSWLSANSRRCTRDEAATIECKAVQWLDRQPDPPWDHLVIGHVHHTCTVSAGTRRLSCLGGWLDVLNYGLWLNGNLQQTVVP